MTQGFGPGIQDLLTEFFPAEGPLSLNQISTSESGQITWLRYWIDRLRGPDSQPTVLPRIGPGDETEWIVLGFNRQSFANFEASVKSFVGPSYGMFLGSLPEDTSDPLYKAVSNVVGLRSFRFVSLGGLAGGAKVRAALELMAVVLQRQEFPQSDVSKTTRDMLRDFGVAIAAGDRESAERELDYMGALSRLDPINLQFQRIRMLSEFGQWQELLRLEGISDIIVGNRPPSVTKSLIESVYYRDLEIFETDKVPAQAIEYFNNNVLPTYANLYQARNELNTPAVIKSFMLMAACSVPPNVGLKDELLALPGISAEDNLYLELLAGGIRHKETRDPETPIAKAKRLVDESDFEGALRIVETSIDVQDSTLVALKCAFELKTYRSQAVFRKCWELNTEEERQVILGTRIGQVMLDAVGLQKSEDAGSASLTYEYAPRNWTEWLRLMSDVDSWSETQMLELADKGADEWGVAQWLTDKDQLIEFQEALEGKADDNVQDILRKAVPQLYTFLSNDSEWPQEELQGIYIALLELVCIDTNGNPDELALANELVGAILKIGIAPDSYAHLVNTGIELIGEFNSPVHFDWTIDLLDLLTIYPCPSQHDPLRIEAVQRSGEAFNRFSDRLTRIQRELLLRICDELGYPIQDVLPVQHSPDSEQSAETSSAENVLSILTGQSVCIYSLTERVNRRVGEILKSLVPDIRIEYSNDKVGNVRLKELARNVDIFVVVTGSAAHAATGFIESNRGAKPILKPLGKGSSSILRELALYATSIEQSGQGLAA